MAKTWIEKLESEHLPKVKTIEKKFADIPAGSKMFIATPKIVQQYIKEIPRGTFISIKDIRTAIAADHNADYTCPVTTGIFTRIIADAAYEYHQQGTPISDLDPFWRIIAPQDGVVKKLQWDAEWIAQRRDEETEL